MGGRATLGDARGGGVGSDALRDFAPPAARWILRERPPSGTVALVAEGLGLSEVVSELLTMRGFEDAGTVADYLEPRLEHLRAPSELPDAERAADRIVAAIHAEESILAHGDYDVDGMCGVALLTRFLRGLGGRVTPFVPSRDDGYDLGPAGLAAARASGATLIVTVDCGTQAHRTIAEAAAEGIDTVVTDHHKVAGALPDAVAVVNPMRLDSRYPDSKLCGAAIAHKLCVLVSQRMEGDPEVIEDYLDLLALATVADVVSLDGENRVLVQRGLERINRSRLAGVMALLKVSGITHYAPRNPRGNPGPGSKRNRNASGGDAADSRGQWRRRRTPLRATVGHLGFRLGPRLNAAGRVGDSMDGVRLLLTDDPQEASVLAQRLDRLNEERRSLVETTVEEALEIIRSKHDPERDAGIVVSGEGWRPGVVGIVASRIAEELYRPTIVVAFDGEEGKGSGRSIPGFDLYSSVAACSGHLVRFGGHRAAAGLTVERAKLDSFRRAFARAARERLHPEFKQPVLKLDLELDLEAVADGVARELERLEPHGPGNPRPVFFARNVRFEEFDGPGRRQGSSPGRRRESSGKRKAYGTEPWKSEHIRATMLQGRTRLGVVGWQMASDWPIETLRKGTFDVAFSLGIDSWARPPKPRAVLKGLRSAEGTGPMASSRMARGVSRHERSARSAEERAAGRDSLASAREPQQGRLAL